METIDPEQTDPRLGRLNQASPPPEVEARIVQRALERLDRDREGRSGRPWLWLAPTAAMGAAAAGVAVYLAAAPPSDPGPEPGLYATGSAPRTLDLGPHRVELAAESEADLVRTQPGAVRIALGRGALDCEVEPLDPDQSFEVDTPHVRVAVVGTRFAVEIDAACTQVRVAEGRVRVDREDARWTLSAGEDRAFCEPQPEPEPPSEADLMRVALDQMAAGETEAAAARFAAYRAAYPDGAFVEDALFHEAVLALRRGDRAAARQLVDRLGERFPESSRRKTLEDMLQK